MATLCRPNPIVVILPPVAGCKRHKNALTCTDPLANAPPDLGIQVRHRTCAFAQFTMHGPTLVSELCSAVSTALDKAHHACLASSHGYRNVRLDTGSALDGVNAQADQRLDPLR
ncbi:hypothetical protein L1887_55176 [Cichorium endivia]|nr:hypothetical protein L1887_55176 [Cichorium endivia]